MLEILGNEETFYLGSLPSNMVLELGRVSFLLAHATPTDNLFKYLPPDSPDYVWQEELEGIDADFVLLGHTHISMIKKVGKTTVINPGSVGQSKDVPAVASYAVWNDGEVEIKRVAYDINKTIEKILSTPLDTHIKSNLVTVLEYGHLRDSL
jgi:predicted phosphodiesterase